MEHVLIYLLLVIVLFVLLSSGIWIPFSLIGLGWIVIYFFSDAPIGTVLASSIWGSSYSWELAALPLFIWLGEILFRSRLSEDMFTGLAPWMSYLPGKLVHINILGCAIFAAVSGSSSATAATIGKITMPELKKRGYPDTIVMGTLAGSGTLGLLIPPSIILIVYGVAAEQSIARLFIAGILPGLVLVSLFMGYVVIWTFLNPQKIPKEKVHMNLWDSIYAARRLIPVFLLIIGIMGSIYLGIASPTDAAAVGVALSLFLSWVMGTLSWRTFIEGVMGAIRTSCMIAFILLGASFLTAAMGFAGIPRDLATWIGSLNLSPYVLIAALTVFFIVLGCFLDGISIVVLTAAVILPMIESSGLNLIWFGIYLVVVVEMSSITPPVGFNLFIIQGLSGEDIFTVAKASIPFFFLLVIAVAIIVAFPDLATFLPEQMTQR